jgi:thioredoxin reductase
MQHDAIVIGGSFAGLEAATYLARGMRTVSVIDSGSPRNRFAAHSHGYLSRDGASPRDILAAAREQVAAYPSVQFVNGSAVAALPVDDGFTVRTSDGSELNGKRLVLAFGISDLLPDIPGIADGWGKTVNHCPYCHGYEFGSSPRGVLHLSEYSSHQARIIREWGPTTYFLNGAFVESDTLTELTKLGITIVPDPVDRLVGDGNQLEGVQLADGRVINVAALYVMPRTILNSDIATQLGCEMETGPQGPIVRTDEFRATTVPGVYAAGDIVRAMHSITLAAADGMMAGTALHRSLFMPDSH